jgi:ParB family chromosome partitioning protein
MTTVRAGIEGIRVGRGANAHVMPFSALQVDPAYNGRPIDREHVESLKLKIQAEGYDESKPIRIRNIDGQFYIRDGLHRFTAMQELSETIPDIKGIPAVVAPKGTNDVDDVINMLNANDGLRFTPLEEAALYKRLLSWGVDKDTIAKRVGRKPAHINERLTLAGAAPEIHAEVRKGTLSATAATKAAKMGSDTQRKLAEKAKSGKTVRVADVEKERDGHTKMVSTRKILTWLKSQEAAQVEATKLAHYREAVNAILGLE